MKQTKMSQMTWNEYALKTDRILILPVGSTEQHGPHLPLCVDTVIATRFAELLSQEVDGVCAPAVIYGYKSKPMSGGGPLFPGTIDLNASTFQALLIDLFLEFARDGFSKIFVLSAHFENDPFIAEAMDIACQKLDNKVHFILSNWWDPMDNALVDQLFDKIPFPGWALEHAAITETSLMMYFAPELVHPERIVQQEPFQPPCYIEYPPRKNAVPPSGTLATALSSSALKGEMIVQNVLPKLKEIALTAFQSSSKNGIGQESSSI